MKRILTAIIAATPLATSLHAAFDINAWKAQYGTALTPSQFYTTRPGPWGDYFNSGSADCANATFMYLGPLGVKARPYDQALSTAAFAALYPPALTDGTGLIQNAFGVMDVPAGAPADGKLYPGDLILEIEDQRIKTATDVAFPFPIQAKSSRGLEIHAGQLVDAAEGRGAVKLKVVRAASSAWQGTLLNAPATTTEVTVNVSGKNFVQLITTSANNALTNWINPRLEDGIGGVLYLNAQTITQKSGYASPIMGKDATNATVLDGATTVTNCIGTRANSMIEYAVPAGYTTLKFKVQTTGTGSITPSVRTRLSTLPVTQPNPRQYAGDGTPVLAPELAPYLESVEFSIPQIGSFGSTYNPNSEKVTNYTAILAERLAREQNADGSWPSGGGDYADGTFRTSLAGLGLLATGNPAYTTHIQKAAAYCAATSPSGWAYPRGTRLMFIAEYYLRTRDASILPGLQTAVNDAEAMITADFTCGHGLNMGYGGAGYIGATGTIGTGLAIASKCPVVVNTYKLDNLLERVQELAGGNGGGLPYSRGGIGRSAFPDTPSAGQSYSCGAGGVLATKIRGGPQYITELFRKKFGAATTYGDADGGHASEALTFIMGSLACQIWGDDAHQANMNRFLWRLTLKRDYAGYINLNTNRLEYHGGDGGCHGGPTYDTGGYLVLLNSHKRNLAITGQPEYLATTFPATPPTYDVDRKLYWRVLNDWNMVDAALGSKMPASLQTKLAELRAMPLGTDLADRTLAFLQREAKAAATLVNGIAGLTSPEKQHYMEMLLGIGHAVTCSSIDSPVPTSGLSNYRFSVNGYNATSTWTAWGGPNPASDPASTTRMTGSVTLTDPSGLYLSTPRVLNFTPTSLNPTTDFQVPVDQQVNMTATFNYTVDGTLAISYTRDIIINPAVPFNVDSRAGDYTNVRKVWIPGNCPIPFEKWNMPIQLPSGITLPGASKNEGTIGFHTYDNGTLVAADDTYKARIRGNPAGYWMVSSDKWGECAALGVNILQGPVLTTTVVSAINPTSANSGGSVSSDSGWPVTRRGVCWSTSPYPTIFDNTTNNGSGTGSFTASLTNLEPGAVYHVRAYATNAIGTAYGENRIFTTSGSNGVWTTNGGGSWPVTGNWQGGVDASGADGVADFSTVTPAADATVTLDGPRSIGGMVFGNAGFSNNWILTSGTGGSLSLEVGSSGTPTITVNGGGVIISAPIIGVDGLIKAGPGILQLAATNTHSGATTVSTGTLHVTGSTSSPVTVASGASLTGTGSLGSNATIQGTLAPGSAGIGTLGVSGTLTLAGTTAMEINKSAAAADKLAGMAAVTYGGTLAVTNLSGTLAAGDTFQLFAASSYAGAFTTLNLPSLTGDLKWDTSLLNVNGSIRVGVDAAITSHPANQSVGQGVPATFSVTVSGIPTPSCQWEISTNGGTSWSPVPGATGTSYTTAPATSGTTGTQYRCVASNNLASVTSNPASLTVTSNALPAFTTQPVTVVHSAAGQSVTFSVTATGTPSPTYQWQVSTTAGASWSNISGATSSTHVFTSASADDNKAFRCVVTNSEGSVPSNTAQFLISTVPVWTNVNGGSWPVAGNWSSSTVASGSGVTADFSRLILPAPATVTLDGARTIGTLKFGDAAASSGWSLNTGSAGPLTLAVTAGTPTITVNNGNATISTVLAGTQGLLKNGAGTLTLTQANTYTGGTSLSAGTLTINQANALGGGAITITGGAIANSSGSAVTLPGAQAWNGNFLFSGPNPMTFSGAVTLNANRTLTVAGADLTVTGAINGAFSLTKAGASQLTLSTGSTYSGGTIVNAGKLLATAGGWYGARSIGTGALTVNSGATAHFTNAHGFGVDPGGRAAVINGGTLQFNAENAISALTMTGGSVIGGEMRLGAITIPVNAAAATTTFATGLNLAYGSPTFNVANGAPAVDLLVSGGIYNTNGFTKAGTGLMKLTGSGTYSGATNISAGTLQLAGGSLGGGNVTVASGATLSGSGNVGGITTVNGNLLLGVDGETGSLAFANNITLAGTSATSMKIRKSAGSLTHDAIATSGTLACGGVLTVTASGDALTTGDTIQLFSATTITGTFTSVTLPTLGGGLVWDTSRLYVDGTISLGRIAQTISFSQPTALTLGDVWVLDAIASSGLPVIISSSNPAVAVIQYGDYLVTTGVGTTTLTASQGGNEFYQAASDVSVTLTVSGTLPGVSTLPVTLNAGGSVTSGGSNIWDGGSAITERGVCWSTSANPTVANSRTLDGTGTADFSSTLTGLTGGQTYYVRAYVKNSAGYAYGGNQTYTVPVNGVWTLNANGNWSTTTNWSGGLVPNGTNSTADFSTLNIAADRTVTLDTAVIVGGMTFGDTTPTHNWILSAGTGGSLGMATFLGAPTITVNNQTASINLPVSGNQGLVKAGTGTLNLGRVNTFSGGLTVNAGRVNLQPGDYNNAIPTGSTVTINNTGTVGLVNTNVANNSIAFVVNQGGTLNFQGYHAHCYGLTLNGGAVTGTGSGKYNNEDFYLQANVTVGGTSPSTISIANGIGLPNRTFIVADATSSPAADLTVSGAGAFRGTGLLTKSGAGTMTLANANVHSGGTTIAAGTLLATNTSGSATGTGAVTVASGATLGGTGIISGPTSVAGSLAPGANGIGTLTVSNTLSLSGTTAIQLNRSGATLTHDKVLGISTLTLGGTLDVTATGDALAAGNSFTLFGATTFAGSFATVNLPALGANLSWDTSALATTGTISIYSTSQPQTITFGPLPGKTYGDPAFTLSATASSGLAVSYTSSNPAVATVSGNTVTIVGAGSSVITASQAGNGSYAPAPDVSQTLSVAQAAQSISFAALANRTYGTAPFALTGTASSGLAVSYASSNTAVATVSGNTVTIVGAGATTITASQGGNANFLAATNVARSLTIDKASQTITFGALSAVNANDQPFDLTATASSGLPVTYTNSNPAAATLSGITVTPVAAGTTTLTATQDGDANYLAATSVAQPLTVNPPKPVITVATAGDPKEAGPTSATFTVTRDQTTGALTVPFTVSGTATSGSDYTALPTSVTMADGVASATVTLTPVDDAVVDPGETVTLTVTANSAYTLGSPAAGTYVILDNDGAQPIPSPWTAADIGSVRAGNTSSVTFGSGSNGTDLFSITGSGSIATGNTSDGMHFVSRAVTGDCEIIARVASHSGTGTNQRVGVAIRADHSSGGAISAQTLLRGGNRSPYFLTRTTLNVASTSTAGASSVTAPYWVRLVRSGNSFSSYISSNGSTWTQISTAVAISNMPATARIGLFVSSGSTTASNTATFDNVTVKQNIASITASATAAAEGTPVTATTFTVSRGSTPPGTALAIPLTLSGTATYGTDYTLSGGSVSVVGSTATVTIPAGQNQVTLTATPVNDLSNEGTETIALAVVTSPAPTTYSTGTPSSASVSITDAPVAALATEASPAEGGSVSGAGTYYVGSNQAISATPAPGWQFNGWTGDEIANSSANPTTVLIDGAKTVTANFSRIQHLITVAASPPEGGFVTGGGVYDEGSVQEITATAAPGWQFAGWTGTGIANPASASTTVTVDADKALTAAFTRIQHVLTVVASPSQGGNVTGSGTYDRGSVQPITATAALGWQFSGWTGSGVANPNATSTTVAMDANKTVTANFTIKTYTLTYTAGANGTLTGSASQVVSHGSSGSSVNAVPTTGYRFVNWSDGSTANPRTDTNVTANLAVTANFAVDNVDANSNGILDSWESGVFGNANPGANPAGADADGDGTSNLMEYALLNSDPTVPNRSPIVHELTNVSGANYLRITVPKNPAATNLSYIVETCDALNNWTTTNTVVETNTSGQLVVRDAISDSTATRRFIRLRVVSNNP